MLTWMCTQRPLLGVKRTWRGPVSMSANDPKRTSSSSLASWGETKPRAVAEMLQPKVVDYPSLRQEGTDPSRGAAWAFAQSRPFYLQALHEHAGTAGCCIAIQLCEP